MINILISTAVRRTSMSPIEWMKYRKIKRTRRNNTHTHARTWGVAGHEKLIQLANLCVPIARLLNASSNHVSIPIVSIIFRCKLFQKHKKEQNSQKKRNEHSIEK